MKSGAIQKKEKDMGKILRDKVGWIEFRIWLKYMIQLLKLCLWTHQYGQ